MFNIALACIRMKHRNDLGLVIPITDHGQIGVGSFSPPEIALPAVVMFSLRWDAHFTSVGLVSFGGARDIGCTRKLVDLDTTKNIRRGMCAFASQKKRILILPRAS